MSKALKNKSNLTFATMSSRKRKRYSRDVKCVFFPDEVEHGLQKADRDTKSISFVSSAKSWEKCGDSFLDTPALKNFQSPKNLSAVRKLAPALVQSTSPRSNEDPVHITWSSSDTEDSENENQEQRQSRVVSLQQRRSWRPGKPTAPIQLNTSKLSMLTTEKDDLPVINTDSDPDDSEEDVDKYSGQQISDCESSSADEKQEDIPLKYEDVKEQEISAYGSDGEDIGTTLTSSKLDSESFPLQAGEGSKRSVGDWVRSAQAMMQTPQKSIDRHPKTPEDSAKKKRKLLSGGLAERLNRLQCRQRSAISFWRHKFTSAPTTTTVDRPGVLVLEVLEVHEECSMQLAHCEHHQPPGDDLQHSNPVSKETARMLVLFNRETAAQLSPAPRDIIHIYPPWQSLSVEGFSCPVILNTHFSQKVFSATKPADISLPTVRLSAARRMPYYLGKTFGQLDGCWTTEESKQAAASDALCSYGGSRVLMRSCVSLLEAIEGLGQAGIVERDVEVVVQRVYSIFVAHSSPVSIKHGVSLRSSADPPPAEKTKTRLCVLVQDGYGTFSVVQLQPLPCTDELHSYNQKWQGRNCVLRGIRVVKRVTRERHSRLFTLIDSLWPPALPLRDHGNSLSMPTESRPPGSAPSFCYLLSGPQNAVEPVEGQNASLLYLHPTNQTLRDIMQAETKTRCCSFVATVLYKRLQSTDVGQGEVWLVLTDPSLQEEQPERPCRRTVALCVNTSCVLTSSVLKALNSPGVCCMSFRDAIREHGVLLCVEQTVIEVCSVEPEGTAESTTRSDSVSQPPPEPQLEPQVKTLPRPVRLDPLSLEATPNSLCTLTGVISGVDENTAYSWPACSLCGSDDLELSAEMPQTFHCVSCKSSVDKPDTKFQLEVFLSSSLSSCTVKVKLQQRTIMSVLDTTAQESNEFQGYDVESVLGKEVGPIAVYVRVISRKPALWIGLEEICL
ncbi:DNA repair-scaffolding protein [Cololabis saira]|uniref:DNA repair-scaffolding protein n=1 Tax=Cololabis saira TaxID=129043 RepID=UPI002AD275DA|nr:DNA repair-scaffolding protein [Cololabis saira]